MRTRSGDWRWILARGRVLRDADGLRSGYLRPLAFLGSEKMGIDPGGAAVHVAIAAWEWGAYLGRTRSSRASA